MKKCPTCQKTFEGAMRFCQTDGTPLVEVVEEPQVIDPLKTMVVGPDDLPELAKQDPMKTMVVSPPKEEDILQIPESFDPMKTMVSSDTPSFKPPSSEPRFVPPASGEPVVKADSQPPINPNDTLAQTPELPNFKEPSLSPPDMGNWAGTPPAPMEQKPVPPVAPPIAEVKPPVSDQPKFDSAPLPSEAPSPFEMPKSSPVAPPTPFEPPPPLPFAKDEPMFGGKQPPFQKSPFGLPEEPLNRPSVQPPAFEPPPPVQSGIPMQAAPEWTPPPAPVAEWQDQSLGQNTPFQPPAAGTGSKNQTLAIVSLVTGIISLLCCTGLFVPGIVAAVLGFIARGKASSNPNEYGGGGMALAGIILGVLNVLFSLVYWVLLLLGAIANPLLQN